MINKLKVFFTFSFESKAAKTTAFVITPTIPVRMAHHLKVNETEELLSLENASFVGRLSIDEVSIVARSSMPEKIKSLTKNPFKNTVHRLV